MEFKVRAACLAHGVRIKKNNLSESFLMSAHSPEGKVARHPYEMHYANGKLIIKNLDEGKMIIVFEPNIAYLVPFIEDNHESTSSNSPRAKKTKTN